MKRIRKSLLVAGVLATAGVSSLGAVSMASAATSSTGPDSLIEKIASKFKLNKDEVKAVFEEERTAREAERLSTLEEKLKTAVTDGKLTQAQSDKIVAKYKEMQANREAKRDEMKDKTEEERKTAMDAERTAFDKWVSDNDIPTEYARLIHMGGHGGHGPGGPRGDKTE